MEAAYLLEFRPEELRDYQADIRCITEREKFRVSVKAIGARGSFSNNYR